MIKRTRIAAYAVAAAFAIPALAMIPAGSAKAAKTVDVTEYGAKPGDGVSDTDAIDEAINAVYEAGGGIVTMPAGDFDIKMTVMGGVGYGLEMKDNVTLQMEKGTKLNVVPNSCGHYEVLRIKNCKNIKVTGGQIIGDKSKHKKSGDENEGHGIMMGCAENVDISDMTIKNCWGDGIYIGNLSYDNRGCNNVKITNCTISANRRNNIAIVHGNNVTIDKCKNKKAKGAQPQCGINIEPNMDNNGKLAANQRCTKITIKNTTVTCVKTGVDNNYFALQIMNPWFQSNNTVVAKTVKITNCTLGGDVGNYGGKSVVFNKCKIKGTFYDKKAMKTKLKKTSVKDHCKF